MLTSEYTFPSVRYSNMANQTFTYITHLMITSCQLAEIWPHILATQWQASFKKNLPKGRLSFFSPQAEIPNKQLFLTIIFLNCNRSVHISKFRYTWIQMIFSTE